MCGNHTCSVLFNGRPVVYSQIFIINSNLTTIFRTVTGIYAVMTCQKMAKKTDVHTGCMKVSHGFRAWRHLRLTFCSCSKFNFFKKSHPNKHNLDFLVSLLVLANNRVQFLIHLFFFGLQQFDGKAFDENIQQMKDFSLTFT